MLGVAGMALGCDAPCDGELFSQASLLSLSQQREHWNFPRLWGMRGTVPYTSDRLLPSQSLQDSNISQQEPLLC